MAQRICARSGFARHVSVPAGVPSSTGSASHSDGDLRRPGSQPVRSRRRVTGETPRRRESFIEGSSCRHRRSMPYATCPAGCTYPSCSTLGRASPLSVNRTTAWDKVRNAYGRPNLAWHELRHVAATILLARGIDRDAVAIQLGHRETRLVDELYGHPSEAAARERLSRAFAGPPQLKSVASE